MKILSTPQIIFALAILGGCFPVGAKQLRPKGAHLGHGSGRKNMHKIQDLKKRSYMLLQSLADLDLSAALTENVAAKVVSVATKVGNISEKSTHDDFVKLFPASGSNDFTKLVEEYELFDRGVFRYIMRPKMQLKDLQQIIKELAETSLRAEKPIKEFQAIQELWSGVIKKFDAAAQKAFCRSANEALELLIKVYAVRTAEVMKSKPAVTEAQRKLLAESAEILKTPNSPAEIFNYSVIIDLGVKDAESANTILKPIYEGIPDVAFLGRALMHWPEELNTPKESLELLRLAQCAYNINNRIQGVVTKMRGRTLFRAKKSLREVSYHLTQLQETLNEVTDNVGPFKKASNDLVSAAEPVIQDLEALKKSITTLIQKLSEETKAKRSAPATPSSPTPAPTPTPVLSEPMPTPTPAPVASIPTPTPEPMPAPVPTPPPGI